MGVAFAFTAVRRFLESSRGNVAITFGIASVPVVLLTGTAVDYSVANRAKAMLDAAADAAALAAVSKAHLSDTPAQAKTVAANLFNGLAAGMTRVTVATPTITVTDATTGRTAVVTYQATTPTAIMGMLGKTTMTVTGTSTAASSKPLYMDFYLLLDNTPSMGVGATPADVSKMVANTSDACAFACHDMSTNNNYYNLAKSLGVTMRIDVVRQATQQLMDTATATANISNQFRAAVYTFGTAAETATGVYAVAPLTSSLSTVKSKAAAVDLMTVPYQNYNSDMDTNFDVALTAMNAAISAPGDGTSASQPQKILFFVSDGVADANNPASCSRPLSGGVRCQEPLDTSFCTTIKNRGIKIAVLYTTYLPLPTNSWYNSWIAPFAGSIDDTMQACASDGLYFEVSPTQGISEAMTALFQRAVAQARLSK